jgi:hypothetical protein
MMYACFQHLAAALNLSPRQSGRAFRVDTWQSEAKTVEMLRVEAAKQMMELGQHPVEEDPALRMPRIGGHSRPQLRRLAVTPLRCRRR